MKVYRKIIEIFNRILEYIGIVLLSFMVLIIFYQVIMRYVFNNTPSWSEEVALLCMIYFSYVGFIMGVKEKVHIFIEVLTAKLPPKALFVLEIIDNIIIMVLGTLMFRYGMELMSRVGNNKLPATRLSAGTVYLMIPIAGAMTLFILIEQTIDRIISEKRGEKIDV